MSKKKPSKGILALVLVGSALIAVNLFFWLTHEEPISAQQVITRKLKEKSGIDPRRKAQLLIQLSLTDYQERNNGKLPAKLEELVPIYFDRVPLDPETGVAFSYTVTDGRYSVGSTGSGRKKGGRDKETVVDPSSAESELLLAFLDEDAIDLSYVYDSTGKRDPFSPFNLAPVSIDDGTKSPLERFAVTQLRLTAVLQGFDEPVAIVEDASRRGHTVTKGTKIGLNSGEVVEILPDKLLVLETQTDFTGQTKTLTIEIPLRSSAETTPGRKGRK